MTSGAGEPPSLERWARDAAVEESARDRARRRHLRDAARGDATLAGALADLAERPDPVTVATTHGSSHTGPVNRVGVDSLVMSTAAAAAVVLRLDCIASIRHASGAPLAGPVRASPVTLASMLSELVLDGPRVQIRSGTAAPVVGRIEAVGVDVVTVALQGADRALVPLAAISEVLVPR